jgi:pimeloyl-ACP methyl ester carboxylesterase
MPIIEVELPSGPMSYRYDGETGPQLLQLHGLGTGHHNYDLLTPKLAANFRVIDIDLPGYGGTAPLVGEPSIAGMAERVVEFIETQGLAPALVHGTSMGGMVAMTLAAKYPDLVSKLIITCSTGRHDNAMRNMRATWMMAAQASPALLAAVTCVDGFSRGFWDRPDSDDIRKAFVSALEVATTDVFIRDLPLMEDLDISEIVPRISAETLLLGADEDHISPVKTSPSGIGMSDLASLIPNASLKVLPECGHFISIERGDETAQEITAFILGRVGSELQVTV